MTEINADTWTTGLPAAAADAGPFRLGGEAHKELYCRTLLETFNPYKPAVIDWPKLDADARDRLVSLPIWDIAVRTEGKASRNVKSYARLVEKDQWLRTAVDLNAFEEARHKQVLANLVEAYGIKLQPEPEYRMPKDPEWAFMVTGYAECVDSFFAFGLFDLAKRSGFFPPDLVDTFEPVMHEEARHILFFVNWVAWRRRNLAWWKRPWFALRVAAVWAYLARERIGMARGLDGSDGSGETQLHLYRRASRGPGYFAAKLAGHLPGPGERPASWLPYDSRLVRPRFVPAMVRLASAVSRRRRRPDLDPLKRLLLIAAAIGLAAATGVIAYVGFGQITAALGVIGWRGLGVLITYSVAPLSALTLAWFVLERPWPWRRLGVYLWARLVRDASGELLPFSHLAGMVIGARAATSAGLPGPWALATTVVDVTTELIAQVGFTLFGLCLLADRLDKHAELSAPAVVGFALTLAAAVSLVALQRRGMTFVTRLVERVLPAAAAHAIETGGLLSDLHGRTGRLLLAILLHLGAWTLSATGVWLALHVAGLKVGLLDIIGLEALISALRSAAFIAPMGLGVQELGYAVLGPVFGLSVESAIALSLIKRARDLCVGLPVLAAWQIDEGRRLIARRPDDILGV